MAAGAFSSRLVVGGLAGLAAVAGGYTVAYPYVCFFYLFICLTLLLSGQRCVSGE